METKTIYFVRHGETDQNAENVFQTPDTVLTEKGLAQAHTLAERCKNLGIEALVSSSYTRALQTSEVISQELSIPIEVAEIFRERTRSKEIVGKGKDIPEVIEILKEIEEHSEDESWHYSDEENFFDLKKRAEKGLTR